MIDKEKDTKVQQDISPEEFQFVQRDEKIFDKKFDTKPIGYFRDAMTRFGKNKANVIATIILFTLIFMSIFVPVLTQKNFTRQEPRLRTLPPRIPILEHFGILDGHRSYENRSVNLDRVDPETGLYLPAGFDEQYIIPDSLSNTTSPCTTLAEGCVGGQNVLSLRSDHLQGSVINETAVEFRRDETPLIEVDIENILVSGTTLSVMLEVEDEYRVLDTFEEEGIMNFDVFERLDEVLPGNTIDEFESQIRLRIDSELARSNIALTSVSVYHEGETDPVYESSGYRLARYDVVEVPAIRYRRANATQTVASFDYNVYERALGLQSRSAYSSEDLYALVETNDNCTLPDSRDDYVGHEFAEGCPVREITSRSESMVINGEEFYTYGLVLDYALYMGYDDIPYFFFGTTNDGHDLFALTWLGLRTSLLIGVIVGFINISVGIVYGSISGYYGGKVDIGMERFTEVISRIPWLLTLAIAQAWLGPSLWSLIIVLTLSGWVSVSSTTRTQFYRYKGREYVLASRTLGAKDSRLIFRHILPNGIGTITTTSILMIPVVIFAESTISFLGFGIGHGQTFNFFGVTLSGVSIGVLLSDGQRQLLSNPHLTLAPALIISILMITFNMFGNALRDAFNPTLRGSE